MSDGDLQRMLASLDALARTARHIWLILVAIFAAGAWAASLQVELMHVRRDLEDIRLDLRALRAEVANR